MYDMFCVSNWRGGWAPCRDYEIRLGPLSGCHSPDVATKLSTILMNLTESAGKEEPATQPRLLKLPVGAGGGHVPKTQRLKRRGNGLRLCNREGAREG